MLDLELIATSGDGLDIVPYAEMKIHLRLSNDSRKSEIESAVIDAAAALHGRTGRLNRTIFPSTWIRYLSCFPRGRKILLPYPPLRRVLSIYYEDPEGGSPGPTVPDDDYVVRPEGTEMVGEVEILRSVQWPQTLRHPRAVAIVFEAGYTTYPPQLKRAVKMLAAHYLENPEATITDRTSAMTNRKVEYGLDSLINALRVPNDLNSWAGQSSMRNGARNNLISIEIGSETSRDNLNNPVTTWAVWRDVFAEITPLRGVENFNQETGQRYSEALYRFKCAFSDVEGMSTTFRISFEGQIYDIRKVLPDYRRREETVIEATLQDGGL